MSIVHCVSLDQKSSGDSIYLDTNTHGDQCHHAFYKKTDEEEPDEMVAYPHDIIAE